MTKDELEYRNAELVALLTVIRNEIDEKLEILSDDEEDTDDTDGDFDDED